MSNSELRVDACDHTDITERKKRMWKIDNFDLPGVHMPSMFVGVGAGTVVFSVILTLSMVLSKPLMPVLGGILGLITGGLVGMGWSNFRPGGMRPSQWLTVYLDWRHRQPKTFDGFDEDVEPTIVNWHVIVWQPDRSTTG